MAVYREFEYIVWALATMGLGSWATWAWKQGPGLGPGGPHPVWGRDRGPPRPGSPRMEGPRPRGPGLKKHDSAMKTMYVFFSSKVLFFLGILNIFEGQNAQLR